MSNTTTINGFGNTDLAKGEARVYNYYTGALIMSVDVDHLQMDEAADKVFACMKRDLNPDTVCSIEIDQMPYSEVRG